MIPLLARRMIALVPLLFGVTAIMFVIMNLLPADPVRAALGQDASPEQIQAYREELHLDDPLWRQYISYVGKFVRGDFGTSIVSRRPVMKDLLHYLPATIELAAASIVLSTLLAIPLGVFAAINRGRLPDRIAQITSLFSISMPVFWFGVLLQILFFAKLGWLPSSGRIDGGLTPPEMVTGMYTIDSLIEGDLTKFVSSLKHLVLPAIALSNINLAVVSRITRSSMLDVLGENYVTAARAKGLAERTVVIRHAFKNALIPIITISGMRFGDLLAGAILTETIFSWPGIGRYSVYSIMNVDYPALMGFAVVAAGIYFAVNLAVDIAYTAIDPRMRAS